MSERLQKVLARAGFGSRRACEDLIAQRHVRVNGEVATLGRRVDVSSDRIEVRGQSVTLDEANVYLLLHKPAGVLTTARDPQRRRTVLDFVPSQPRVFPVGRLDRDTSGLLLLTNDGAFANKVMHPRYGVPKTYVAAVAGEVRAKHLQALRRGVVLDDGTARADQVRIVGVTSRRGSTRSIVEVVVREGRNRLVRRLLETVGLPVETLTRVAIGPLRLGRLKEGDVRELSRVEVVALLETASSVDSKS